MVQWEVVTSVSNPFEQAEICAASAAELVASVVGGEDGCFVSLGSSSTG